MPLIRSLSLHADYACRRSGACCTSGWAIPVESALHARLTRALAEGVIKAPDAAERLFVPSPGLPAGCAAVLGTDEGGGCRFHDAAGTCAIQRQTDHGWLPAACRQFPRVSLVDDRGVTVSLSHYCPTAARMLLRDDVELSIVEEPAAFPAGGDYEGLEARGALPPLLTPDVLMDLESFDLWERRAVGVLALPHRSPEAALAVLSAEAEAIRAWRHADGSLADHVRAVTSRDVTAGPARPEPDWTALDAEVRSAVLAAVGPAEAGLYATHAVGAGFSRPEPAPLDRTVRRYLAAKVFGSWVAYQGRGLRTMVRSLEATLAVARVEAARVSAAAGRGLDEALLVEAIRAADLLLVHLADREGLARDWSGAEEDRGGR